MPAGLVDIISYGSQDLFLTGTPQITFWKVVYRRYGNFAIESIEVPFDNPVEFGSTSDIIIRPIGDLINNMYLKIKIPKMVFIRSITSETVKHSSQKLIQAYDEYKRCLVFMNVNSNAYRAAMEICVASNILYSEEMVDVILKVFSSYSVSRGYSHNSVDNDIYNISDNINWFYVNSPIDYIDPSKFNLFVIAQKMKKKLNCDPSTITKENFKLILDQAIDYCHKIQIYYEDVLNDKLQCNGDTVNQNYKFAWVERLGHAIIDHIDILIGGERIDRHYGVWLNVWYELCGKKQQNSTYMKMIGNIPELTNFDRNEKPEYTLYIPLQFWFNRFNGLSIPIIALQYYDVVMSIKLKSFRDCAYIEKDEKINIDDLILEESDRTGYKRNLDVTLLIDYIYLDSLERKRFAESSHEYLIDQLQIIKMDDIDIERTRVRLDFIHPCKELIWILQKNSYIENKSGFTKCRWDNYTPYQNNKGFSTYYSSLDFNGYPRTDKLNAMYFNYLQPYKHHKNTPSDGIYVYSFAHKPEEPQPTGSCNFTRITRAILNLWIDPIMFSEKDTLTLWIFAVNHNILRIFSGIGGLAYI